MALVSITIENSPTATYIGSTAVARIVAVTDGLSLVRLVNGEELRVLEGAAALAARLNVA